MEPEDWATRRWGATPGKRGAGVGEEAVALGGLVPLGLHIYPTTIFPDLGRL